MGYFLSLSKISKSAAETGLNVSEILLLVCGFVLAWGCIGEYLEEHERLDRFPRWLQWPSLVFILMVAFSLVGEFLGDAGVYLFSYHLQSIEEAELTRLGADADRLEKRLRLVDESSSAAGQAAIAALDNSGKAVSSSTVALNTARGARQEADSFEKDIVSAKQQSAAAESHLAEAHKEALEARRSLDEYKKPRTLSDVLGLVNALSGFNGTEFTFGSVFGDDESLELLRKLDEALGRARWKRVKQSDIRLGIPAVQIYGEKSDLVELQVRSGVRVEVEAKETVEELNRLPREQWPAHVRLALFLNDQLFAHVSPPETITEGVRVNVTPGDSKVIRIKVGKKP
jgi:hypothetical protein